MLKFIKHNLEGIDGIEIYPIISLLIFFAVFITMFVIVLKLPKSRIEEISQLPLEEDTNNTLSCDNSHYMKNNNCLPLAFPGAEGFGAKSLGGRGGDIYHVSNLNDSGSGSLRTCIEAEGKRNCVFDIGGTIELLSPLVVKNPYLSILGQTTPKDSGGVTLKAKKSSTYDGTLLQIVTNNVVVRYMRLRRGSMTEDTYSSAGDCLTMGSANSDDAHDIIIDHCSISWSFDENIPKFKSEVQF